MKNLIVVFLVVSFLFLVPTASYVVAVMPTEPLPPAENIDINVTPPTNLRITAIGPLISGAISFVLAIALLLAFVYLIWGGIQWITSGGDKAATESARGRIQAAILGLFIVFAAWAIMMLVSQFFGMSFPNFTFQTGF